MKKIITYFLAIAVTAGLLASCSKKLEEAYLNPNAPTKVAPEELLPPIIYNMAQNPQRDMRYLCFYIQNFARITSNYQPERMGYFAGSDALGDHWRMHYWLLGQNVLRMIDWAGEEEKWDYVGVGNAIMAWSWLNLTDYHGEVILKEAFNQSLLTFKYDTQEEVYAHVRNLCHTALNYLNRTGGGVSQANLAKGDFYFLNGDVNKWKKFVYGVLARSFHHLTNKSSYRADSVIKYCDLSLATTADDAMINWANTGLNDEANFFGPFRGNFPSHRQSQFVVDLLTGINPAFNGIDDPRKHYFIRKNPNGNLVGLEVAKGQTPLSTNDRPLNFWGATGNTSNDLDSRFVFRNNSEWPVMTASEIQFIKAEAAFKKNDKVTALAAYKKGIELSFDMLISHYPQNIPAGDEVNTTIRNNFVANPAVVPTNANNLTLTHIMLQKYIALWGHGMVETWVDMRRYHYLDIDPATSEQVYRGFAPPSGTTLYPDNNGKLVYRVRPRFNSEYVWNIGELGRIGATATDYHTNEMWFSMP